MGQKLVITVAPTDTRKSPVIFYGGGYRSLTANE